jgi:tetratricopeptide (TPR) repeat protein
MGLLARLILMLCIAAIPAAQATERSAPDLARAEALLRAGQIAAAWQLLEPHEAVWAGEQNFDYLLGLAALESGQFSRASFILERVVGVNPDHAAARLDLARALYAGGDLERAKLEFTAVRQYNPPEAAEQTIRRHLDAIEQQVTAGKVRLTGYAEIGFGTDSNVNAGVTSGEYFMPILNANLESRARRTRYGNAAAGLEVVLPDTPEREFFGGIDMRRRHHQHLTVDSTRATDYYDTRGLDVRLGVQQKLDAQNALRFTSGLSRQTLDDQQPYRRSQSLQAEWRHSVDSSLQGSLWLMGQRNRYGSVDGTSFRQYGGNQGLAGLGVVKGFGEDNSVVAQLTLYAGQERATDIAQGNLDGDKRITGLRLGGQWRIFPALHLLAAVGGSQTRYDLVNTLFLDRRNDILWDASLGAQWRMSDTWSLRPQFAYARSDSNFGAYDYARHDYSLTLRYDFR